MYSYFMDTLKELSDSYPERTAQRYVKEIKESLTQRASLGERGWAKDFSLSKGVFEQLELQLRKEGVLYEVSVKGYNDTRIAFTLTIVW